jgi:hypothetical protein
MVWICRMRAFLLVALVMGMIGLASVPALSGSGSKSSPQPAAASTTQTEAPATSQSGLSEAQRQLCQTAFSNGSGTKFADEAAFEAACLELFPPLDDAAQGDKA